MSFSLVISQLLSLNCVGACSQRALGIERAAMVAMGWNFGQSLAFLLSLLQQERI